jgi:hypothetical protein
LALSSPASGGRSVGIVHWRTEAAEFVFVSKKYSIGDPCSSSNIYRKKITFSVTAESVCLMMFSPEAVNFFSIPFSLLGDNINLQRTPNIYMPFDSLFSNLTASTA